MANIVPHGKTAVTATSVPLKQPMEFPVVRSGFKTPVNQTKSLSRELAILIESKYVYPRHEVIESHTSRRANITAGHSYPAAARYPETRRLA